MYVSHPLIRENTIESRVYQEVIVASAASASTLVCAPTALGKTVIAVMLAAHRLEKLPGSKVLMLSPTKPLANQHAESFKKFLKIPEDEIVVLTGHTPPAKRLEAWKTSKVISATPQVIQNDLISGAYTLSDVSLLIFDEAHRAVGDYPYPFIAGRYRKNAKNPLVLALTASPGSSRDKILEVLENLGIKNIEIKTEDDPDVSPYIKGIKIK